MERVYPKLIYNLTKLLSNANNIADLCHRKGIKVAGVYKVTCGNLKIAETLDKSDVDHIASSHIEHLKACKEAGLKKPTMLVRIPARTELDVAVKYVDILMASKLEMMELLNTEAKKQNKIQNVLVMTDIGDLREGYWDKTRLAADCEYVEKNLHNLHLIGVGTNVGCYGSVEATPKKLQELVHAAEMVEKKIGRELEIISGGATSSLPRLYQNNMPPRINHLRIGEMIFIAPDLEIFYGMNINNLYNDVVTLKAELVEYKIKPTHPVGALTIDAFGNKQKYVDRGRRKRGLLAVGKLDYYDTDKIIPMDKNVEIIGGSSDYTIIDLQDYKEELYYGKVFTFRMVYMGLAFLSHKAEICTEYIEGDYKEDKHE